MLRALLARLGLTSAPPRPRERPAALQLELSLERQLELPMDLGLSQPPESHPVEDGPTRRRRPDGARAPERASGTRAPERRRREKGREGNGWMKGTRELDANVFTGGAPRAEYPEAPPSTASETSTTTPSHSEADAIRLLGQLHSFGMRGISTLRLTRNRSTLVSFRAHTLRLHAGFATASEDVLRAVAVFVSGRGAPRAAARRIIVAYPLPLETSPRPPRAGSLHPDDQALAQRLQREHERLNVERFGGALARIRVIVSRRMKTRLGHYAPARSHPAGAEIAISRRHIRRHGWREALDTLLHEMVHQWQEESGHPIDHGPTFRRKARDVGTTPRARRVLR